jgi:NADP-dependent 3-hydroxy acid dehydrogenase YdfG
MNETLEEIKKEGGTVVGIKTDVSKEADINAMIPKSFGRIRKIRCLGQHCRHF